MDKLYYVAIIERGSDGYYASFPDLPGLVSAGDTVAELAENAELALAMHVSAMIDDGEMLPDPTDPLHIPADPEVEEAGRVMLGVLPEPTKVRVNVMLDRNLVSAIDAHAANRSRFLTEAARAKLRKEMTA